MSRVSKDWKPTLIALALSSIVLGACTDSDDPEGAAGAPDAGATDVGGQAGSSGQGGSAGASGAAGHAGAAGDAGPQACVFVHVGVPACDDCLRVFCEQECVDAVAEPEMDALQDCLSSCPDTTCRDACNEQYPAAAQAVESWDNCYAARCYWPCQGNPGGSCVLSGSSASCHDCLRYTCKTDCIEAGLEPTTWDYLACASECDDAACLEPCRNDFPDAAALFDTLEACLDENCGSDCDVVAPDGTGAGTGPAPTCATKVAGLPLPHRYVRGVGVADHRAYVTCKDDDDHGKLAVVDVSSPATPTTLGWLDLGTDVPWSVQVRDDLAFVAIGTGLLVLDVSDPGAASILGKYDHGSTIQWSSAHGSLVYLLGPSEIVVVDVSTPATPTFVSQMPIAMPTDIHVDAGLAYVAYDQGLTVIDVSDPNNLSTVGSFFTSDLATSVRLSGDLAYMTNISQGFRVLDASDPAALSEISHATILTADVELEVVSNTALMTNKKRLMAVDVSDPASPVVVGKHATASHPTGLAVEGDYAYVSNGSQSDDGFAHPGELEVFDISGCL